MILVAWIAWWTRSASLARDLAGAARGRDAWRARRSPSAIRGDTRLKSLCRQERRLRALVSRNICISTPELDAVGVRLDLGGLGRQLVGHAREDVLGAVLLGLRGHVGDLRVGVGERDLSDVGVDRVLAAAVGALELDLDARAVGLVPLDDVVALHLRLVASWCRSRARSGGRRCFGPVRVVMTMGLPVVSWPYMPAALMPMPCWPRLWRRRWNFEP